MSHDPPALLIPMVPDVDGLEIARQQTRQFLHNNGVDEHTIAAVELVLEEAVTNVIRYGYDSDTDPRQIDIDLQVDPDEVRVLVLDDGKPFDPTEEGAILLPETLDEAQVGGLGLLMIRNSTSRLAYERTDGRNRFLMLVPRHRSG